MDAGTGSTRSIRVLLVEDDPDIRLLFIVLLEQSGYETTAVTGVHEALTALSAREYDLVMTDYQMAGRNGDVLIARTHGLAEAHIGLDTLSPGECTGYAQT